LRTTLVYFGQRAESFWSPPTRPVDNDFRAMAPQAMGAAVSERFGNARATGAGAERRRAPMVRCTSNGRANSRGSGQTPGGENSEKRNGGRGRMDLEAWWVGINRHRARNSSRRRSPPRASDATDGSESDKDSKVKQSFEGRTPEAHAAVSFRLSR
jgi:hypothetical protein